MTTAEARQRLTLYGPNLLKSKRKTDTLTLLLAQFKSPIIVILLGAAILLLYILSAEVLKRIFYRKFKY